VQELKVRTGRRQGQGIEILSALDPADRFVKAGGAMLSVGDLVHVVGAVPAP
jgi:hypothetical protein